MRTIEQTEQSGRVTRILALVLGAALLTACSEPQLILPGEREGLRAVLQDPEADEAVENLTLPISLGAQENNANWAQFWGSPAERVSHPALGANLTLQWRANIGAGNSRRQRISADPVVGGGRIYTLDAGALITALSPSGSVLWQQDLAPSIDGADEATGGGLAYSEGRLYVGLGFGTLSVLDATDGSLIWQQELEATASGAPTVSGDLVYIAAGDNTGWALNKETGRVEWQVGSIEDVRNVLGAPAPVLTSDLAIFAFGSGDVQAVFRRGGLRRWDASILGERRGFALSKVGDITAPPVVDGDRTYVGNLSGRVIALTTDGGKRIWTAQEGAAGPIWPAGDSLFLVTDRNELVRLSKEDGARIWGVRLPNFVSDRPKRQAEVFAHFGPIVAGGRVVLTSSDGVIRSFDPTDGTLLSSVEIPSGAAATPAIAGGTLYVLNAKGELLAYR